MTQRIEVEQKFAAGDFAAMESRLAGLGASVSDAKLEADLYFAHPARDFAATDEALRIRRSGESAWITYKGPKIDTTTKTRREIDLPLAGGSDRYASWRALVEALGFRPVAEVVKHRRKAIVAWEGRHVEVSLDQVDEVGTFVELEIVTEAGDVDRAKAHLASLAQALELAGNERRSYLELLLSRRGGAEKHSSSV
jgi:adenylate cyclase, class 2